MEDGKKILTVPLRISVAFICIGALLIIQHWPFGKVLVTAAFGTILILYPIRFYKKNKIALPDIIALMLVCSWSLHGIFTVLHLPFRIIFTIIAIASLITWSALKGIEKYSSGKAENKGNFFSILLFGCAAFFILAGVAFKILHWPYAPVLLVTGFVAGAIWMFKGDY
jgi:hypothetical protein